MLHGSLLVRLTRSAYQSLANAATVSVTRSACASLSACLAAAGEFPWTISARHCSRHRRAWASV